MTHQRTCRLAGLFICSLFACLLACDGFSFSFTFIIPKQATQTDTQTLALPAGAAVVINNESGSTRVIVDPSKTEATLEITRVALAQDQEAADALLAQIVVTVTAPSTGDNTLRIDAPTPAGASGSASDFSADFNEDELHITAILQARSVATVRLKLTLPSAHPITVTQKNGLIRTTSLDAASTLSVENGSVRCTDSTAGVTITTDNGSVDIRDHRASLDATIDNGSLDIEVLSLAAGQQIIGRVDNGDIDIELPRTIDARLKALAERGRVHFFPLDFVTTSGTISRTLIDVTLNAGGPAIDLRTENGSIDID